MKTPTPSAEEEVSGCGCRQPSLARGLLLQRLPSLCVCVCVCVCVFFFSRGLKEGITQDLEFRAIVCRVEIGTTLQRPISPFAVDIESWKQQKSQCYTGPYVPGSELFTISIVVSLLFQRRLSPCFPSLLCDGILLFFFFQARVCIIWASP